MKKILSHSGQESRPPRSTDEGQKILYLPYVQSLSERTEQVCRPLNIRTVFNSSFTLQQSLVQVKNCTLADRKKDVVYEITCGDCEAVYIGETGRTLQKRVTEHKYAVQGYDVKNGCPCMEQRTQSRLGLSQSGGIGPIHLGEVCY